MDSIHQVEKRAFFLPFVNKQNHFRVCDIRLLQLPTIEEKKEYMLGLLDIYIKGIKWFVKPPRATLDHKPIYDPDMKKK
jgi:hypothetical protein